MSRTKLAALSLFASTLPFAAMAQEAPLTPPELTEQAIEMLGKAIAFNTVAGQGNTMAFAQYLSGELQKAGFAKSDIVIRPFKDTATLVAYYRGASHDKPILLSAHMDVVEAKPEDWTRDPFTMVREDGYLYGRGATDNKFGLVMATQALMRLKKEGFKPSRDLILVFSGDEETSMESTAVLAEEFKDAGLVLNTDGGGGGLNEEGVPTGYYLQGAEKTYADYTVSVTNPGGHSSLPRKDNAIYDLARAALNISKYEFPVMSSDITLESFRQVGLQTEGKLGEAMRNFAENPKDKKAIKELSSHPEFVGQLRTTCIATLVNAGHATNALPQRAEMNVNCRIFPGVSPDEVMATLKTVIDNPDASVELRDPVNYSDASPLRDDVVAAVRKAVDRRYPGLPIVPEMSAGASDSLHFRGHGVDSYGVSGIFMKSSDMFAHGLNERTPEAAVDGALDHWHVILTELAGGE
ncbi:MAG: M20/M25/M40 family metallo-hydrolase [Parvularculaceae bacterium]